MRTYEITERPKHLGGGWNLRFYEDGEHAGGGVFPVTEEDPQAGITWWNAMTEEQRGHWLKVAGSAVPADARYAYLVDDAHSEALDEGESWVSPPLRRPHP